jgi:Leucine-rich repeat (LRR) protein
LCRVLGNLKSLDVSGNRLASLNGLEKLIALININLADNMVEDYRELSAICKLPFLEDFTMMGNPVSAFPEYRCLVYQYLLMDGTVLQYGREIPKLDGYIMTHREFSILRFESEPHCYARSLINLLC